MLQWTGYPASDGVIQPREELFRDAAALGRDGKWIAIGRRGVPTEPRSLLAMAEFLDRYSEIFVATSPPRPLQRILVPHLARLARRRMRSPSPD